ncbi:MAG TPA: high-affinity branched-chain amino acid ABC transporter permease LivM [Nitrospirae bacterium]|nr:high-affinity branched-chain amino acid ABC transporter permease LivM [Nitrospirota bacterium]HDL19889.1 high-affinity branched-chain amino acid ABC transporter permease LivM [Nitrospirota bacterium]HDZ03275.1 high-affinity branched-chain amino acid ABC transporter permease LivM [Nitrospirota bacterium]
MLNFSEIKKSLLVSLWFMFLTFPIMVIRVNPIEKAVEWRWRNMLIVGVGSFVLSFLWRYSIKRKEAGTKKAGASEYIKVPFTRKVRDEPKLFIPILIAAALFAAVFPFIFSTYQVNIMATVLMYVMLGLGLNIVVGLAGLLDLGYVAFYAVGAYSYALLNYHFGLSFWIALPAGALIGAVFGILLGFPVLRLRGDYLAIVTLGFGEIIRLILENWNEFSFGPSGIANIPRPSLFGIHFSLQGATIYLYFIMIGLVLFTIFVVNRLQNSRIGRAWIALREDEIACQAMGIDKVKTKLAAFALGATWAGMAGVIFAAKTTFINPASFTFLESALILSIVVLGGMGSIIGVICGAFILILLPEYLRAFSDYRMLLFGAIMVLMMVFRPQGLISNVRRSYELKSGRQ